MQLACDLCEMYPESVVHGVAGNRMRKAHEDEDVGIIAANYGRYPSPDATYFLKIGLLGIPSDTDRIRRYAFDPRVREEFDALEQIATAAERIDVRASPDRPWLKGAALEAATEAVLRARIGRAVAPEHSLRLDHDRKRSHQFDVVGVDDRVEAYECKMSYEWLEERDLTAVARVAKESSGGRAIVSAFVTLSEPHAFQLVLGSLGRPDPPRCIAPHELRRGPPR